MVGTRGVPAMYGGFETAVEEIGTRLVGLGHDVRVYCRNRGQSATEYRGMELVNLPALRLKATDTLTHAALSLLHCRRHPVDAIAVFNAANAPLRRLAGATPCAIHVDGLESRRGKWGRFGKSYFRWSERRAVRSFDTVITDADGIREYYQDEYGARPVVIRYGMPPPVQSPDLEFLQSLGVAPRAFHLVVARFEPENHVLEAVAAQSLREPRWPLIVVGDAPYSDRYKQELTDAADAGTRFVGSIWDQSHLDTLYATARTYIHGHSVGGTNPSLLRALAQCAPVLAHDNVFNREVAASGAEYWRDAAALAALMASAEQDDSCLRAAAHTRNVEMRSVYDWDAVAKHYAQVLESLAER
jgi:glycosyltransferase involved in cell wall biosynthesis